MWRVVLKARASICDDEILAKSIGFNTVFYKILNFAIACFFAGIAGALLAFYQSSLSGDIGSIFGLLSSIYLIIYLCVGGESKFSGPILGTLVMMLLFELSRPLEELQNMLIGFIAIINHVDFCLKRGEILGLIGPNGAGKSTLLNMVGGAFPSDKGSVFLDGRNITKLPAYRRAKIGIGRVFQRNAFFGSFTVMENVIAGLMLHHGSRAIGRAPEKKNGYPSCR